jgi:hypothetical protein
MWVTPKNKSNKSIHWKMHVSVFCLYNSPQQTSNPAQLLSIKSLFLQSFTGRRSSRAVFSSSNLKIIFRVAAKPDDA